MSNIEKALKKKKEKIKETERAFKTQSGVNRKSNDKSSSSQEKSVYDSGDSIQDFLGSDDLKSQTDSTLNRSDSHIMSAIEKRDVKKKVEQSLSVNEDYDQLMEESGLVPHVQDPKREKEVVKIAEPTARISCGDVDEHIVSYYENIGKQTWKGPVMVNFRRLQVELSSLQKNNSCKVMLFTSSQQKEGKSTVSLNTAITLCSDKKKKVVIVDCDFRKPTINRLLDFVTDAGLSDYLLEEVGIKDILHSSMIPNLTIVPAGSRPTNTCELFSTDKMAQFVSHLKEQFDFVIIDTPPILAFPDTVILGPLSDGVIFVINCKKAKKAIVKRAVETLGDIKPVGFILNNGDSASIDYYGYGYGSSEYYYYDDNRS